MSSTAKTDLGPGYGCKWCIISWITKSLNLSSYTDPKHASDANLPSDHNKLDEYNLYLLRLKCTSTWTRPWPRACVGFAVTSLRFDSSKMPTFSHLVQFPSYTSQVNVPPSNQLPLQCWKFFLIFNSFSWNVYQPHPC